MASLREIKDRIGSVRSTLKITSAMKLVASAKLRKAQRAIEDLRPYEQTLAEILSSVSAAKSSSNGGISPEPPAALESLSDFADGKVTGPGRSADADVASLDLPRGEEQQSRGLPTAVVAIASNSSLCGAFNANVVREALRVIRACEGGVEVYPIGRKMADALRRAGYTASADYNDLIGHPSYEKSAALARSLSERYHAGELGRVVLVYNRFVSASTQTPVEELYLPFEYGGVSPEPHKAAGDYLLEPDAQSLVDQLLPQVMLLKFHAAILDSAAAEQAARTIAMQTASDNAEQLLGELTLEYNKGRQQKITAEILDLVGGLARD